MQSTIEVITPAESIDLISLDELKLALNITGTTQDQMLSELITRVSAEIAAYCNNRVFGYESVIETFTEIPEFTNRLWLGRFPVKKTDIVTISENGTTLTPTPNGMLLDSLWGKLQKPAGSPFIAQTIIDYSGGYHLPEEAPPALKQAATMLMRESYYASIRGDATVRMIGHKESRVIYFDPNALAKSIGGATSGGTAAQRASRDLLDHFTRFEV